MPFGPYGLPLNPADPNGDQNQSPVPGQVFSAPAPPTIDPGMLSPPPGTPDQTNSSDLTPSTVVHAHPEWGKIAGLAGAGLGIGLLASHASKLGGKLSFGEALGMLGKGYANQKSEQMQQTRQMAAQQHEQQLAMIHKIMTEMPNAVDRAKYPRLGQLQDKYRELLTKEQTNPNGQLLPPKEATEFLGLWATAQGELSKARGESENAGIMRRAKAESDAAIAARQELYMTAPPNAGQAPMDSAGARAQAIQDLTTESQERQLVDVPQHLQAFTGSAKAQRKDVLAAGRTFAENQAAMERVRMQGGIESQREKAAFDREQAGKASSIYQAVLGSALRGNPLTGIPPVPVDKAVALALDAVKQSGLTMTAPPQGASGSLSKPYKVTGFKPLTSHDQQ